MKIFEANISLQVCEFLKDFLTILRLLKLPIKKYWISLASMIFLKMIMILKN